MAVIAFTQEMATLGSDVAAGVCEALGLGMVRHEVGDVVAGKMHVKKSLIRRLREGKAGPFERWTADEKSISIFTAEEVFDLAVKVAEDSRAIDERDFAALRTQGFTDEDIWDVAGVSAFFSLSNRFANFLALRPNDEFYLLGRAPR